MKSLCLALLLTVSCGLSYAHASSASFPGSVPILLGYDSIRKDLSLSRSQCTALDRLRSSYKSDARAVTARSPQTAVEKNAANTAIESLNAKYNARALALLTPAQTLRLDQIGHQTLGAWMLFLPRIQDSLHLADGQKALISKIEASGKTFVNDLNHDFEDGKISLQERLEKLRHWRNKESKKLMRLLTPEQRRSLQSLHGPAFQAT